MTFSSVDPDGLDNLVLETQGAMMSIDSYLGTLGYSSIQTEMSALGVTSAATTKLTTIVNWMNDEALPDLRRRLNLARGLQQASPDSTMVQVDDDLVDAMSSEEAQERGAEIATALTEATSDGDSLDEVMADLEALVNDPDAMAGFYGELGPEASAILAASLGQGDGIAGDNSQAYLELLSIGLGTALKVETRPGALYDMNDFWEETDNPAEAWGRLALLQYGDFSTDQFFVQMTVEGTALDAFTRDDWAEQNGPNISNKGIGPWTSNTGLPTDVATLAFQVLGQNPEASREALSGYEDFPLSDFVDRVYEAGQYPHDRPELADAFGEAIVAGTGSEGDPPSTEHTPEEAEFAFQFITASGSHSPDEVPVVIMDSIGQVGGSYVHELVAGSWVDNGEGPGFRDSSRTEAPADFPGGTGLDPAFYLDPETTYQFMGSFQRELEYSQSFDENAGLLYEQMMNDAIAADGAHPDDYTNTENVNRLFGGLSEFQYQARREWAADFDAQEAARRAGVAQFWGSAAAIIPVPGAGHYIWWGVQVIGNDALGDWADGGQGQEEQVVNEHATAETLRWYQIVAMITENDQDGSVLSGAPSGLVGDDGNLLPMDEIFADENLTQEFYDWVQDTPELNGPADQSHRGWNNGTGNNETFLGE